MAEILVSGLINLETTLRVEGFPIAYQPVRYPFHGVASTISGVGYNLARALTRLGNGVRLLSLIGADLAGRMALESLRRDGLGGDYVLASLPATAQSVILYDGEGWRGIYVDLKDIQERAYPPELFQRAAAGCSLAVLCNINFSRPFLAVARELGLPVASDVHAIAALDDDYNRDFMAAADVLFMSHELLPEPPADFARRAQERYANRIVVVGLGAEGALLALRDAGTVTRVPAVAPRPIVSTIGAGDALFACFLSQYLASGDPLLALRRAVFYAGYKIGAAGAADGLLTAAELDALCP